MSVAQETLYAIQKCIAWLAATQDEQGGWTGAFRSNFCIWYAAGLAIEGETQDSAVIANICEYLESCICADGGFSPYPGEPSTGIDTATAIPLLRWARRDPAIISRAVEYLGNRREKFNDPITQFLRWIFEPESHLQIGSDRGPYSLVQRALLIASRKHPTVRWKLYEKYPRSYREPGLLARKWTAFLIRGLMYPRAGLLAEGMRVAPQPIGFETALLTTAAIRKLAGDASHETKCLIEFALDRRRRFALGLYSYEWLSQLVADMFFTQSMGMNEEYERSLTTFRRIRYEGNGWLRGLTVANNVFDTALTLQALHGAGFSAREPMTQKARDFLLAAQRPVDGLWSWAYNRNSTRHPGLPDSDDSGSACVALAQLGDAAALQAVKNAMESISGLQERDGSFSTFGEQVLRPNWAYVANTSRATQALLAAGVDRADERVRRAFDWVRSQQLPDGSWVDGWCSRYIYGTATALELLALPPIDGRDDAALKRAKSWLLSVQNPDGGWGENWYGGQSHSTSEHTGLALRALSLVEGSPGHVIESGAQWLINAQREDGAWNSCYFVDFGFGSGYAESQLPVVWALHGLGSAIRALEGSPALLENRTG